MRVSRATPRLEVRPQPIGNGVGLVDAELMNLVPFGSATVDRARHMEVKMGDRLVRIDPVVLPDTDSRTLFHGIDGPC
ncbi:hypothetical protein JCM10369A_29940 [Nocardioides pyridinolyticus]